jgi:hypothetical protein
MGCTKCLEQQHHLQGRNEPESGRRVVRFAGAHVASQHCLCTACMQRMQGFLAAHTAGNPCNHLYIEFTVLFLLSMTSGPVDMEELLNTWHSFKNCTIMAHTVHTTRLFDHYMT